MDWQAGQHQPALPAEQWGLLAPISKEDFLWPNSGFVVRCGIWEMNLRK